MPEGPRAADRLRQLVELRTRPEIAIARDGAGELRYEVRVHLRHPHVRARVQQLAEHLGPRARIPDEEEWRDGTLHDRRVEPRVPVPGQAVRSTVNRRTHRTVRPEREG